MAEQQQSPRRPSTGNSDVA
ncbi:hypothetical protein A2U01_0107178, partial [Trifolium medium]|nr:hypothetical protein [Trifolium medium]